MSNATSSIRALALSVTSKYGLNKCYACAIELRAVMKAAGKKGCILKLSTLGGRGFIVMKDVDFKVPFNMHGEEAIASSGQHFGVHVGGFVFDNVHREGIARASWQGTFDCDVHAFVLAEQDRF
jgi:Papain fold toxin 2